MDTPRIILTRDDILKAVTEAMHASSGEEASTTEEIAAQIGKGVATTLKYLRPLARDGRIVPVKVKRQAINGNMVTVTGWKVAS